MGLLKILWRRSAWLLTCSIVASLGTAALMLFMLAAISQYLSDPDRLFLTWWELLAAIVAAAGLQITASVAVSALSQRTVRRLRTDFVERVLEAPLITLEKQGGSQVLAALVEDASRVAEALPGIVALARDLTFMAASIAYLAFLSLKVTGMTVGVIVAAALIVFPLQAVGGRYIQSLRSQYQSLFALFRNVFDGLKQIKLSFRQHGSLITEIESKEAAIASSNVRAFMALSFANAVAVVIFLLLIEFMIFGGLSAFSDRHVMTTYMLVLIFILGPLQSITTASGSLSKARVAIDRIVKLQLELESANQERGGAERGSRMQLPAPVASDPAGLASWRELRLSGLRYEYQTADRQTFQLGPIDLVLRPGELFFLVGGNGSGKTTLGKLLAGLYVPMAGEIRIDGVVIDDSKRRWYREHFSAVFSDFCLFDGLAGSANERFGREAPELVDLLKLGHVLDPDKGIFAQSASFSSGERHRTALLLASLDDRPIYIFDEFAADQDPGFKDLFYRDILKRMRAQGKLVIIITHDSRYFDEADSIMTLERGLPPVIASRAPLAANLPRFHVHPIPSLQLVLPKSVND